MLDYKKEKRTAFIDKFLSEKSNDKEEYIYCYHFNIMSSGNEEIDSELAEKTIIQYITENKNSDRIYYFLSPEYLLSN